MRGARRRRREGEGGRGGGRLAVPLGSERTEVLPTLRGTQAAAGATESSSRVPGPQSALKEWVGKGKAGRQWRYLILLFKSFLVRRRGEEKLEGLRRLVGGVLLLFMGGGKQAAQGEMAKDRRQSK